MTSDNHKFHSHFRSIDTRIGQQVSRLLFNFLERKLLDSWWKVGGCDKLLSSKSRPDTQLQSFERMVLVWSKVAPKLHLEYDKGEKG